MTNEYQMPKDREKLVTAEAFAFAIATIQALPKKDQPNSDMCDMCRLQRGYGQFGEVAIEQVRRKGLEIDPDADRQTV